jgi:CheY-like chemotaxis protein
LSIGRLEEALAKLQEEISEREAAEKAVKAERQPYDLILMDVRMPEMDGITASREICKRWPNTCPKIVAITAYALAGDKERCLDAGMDGYIAKPVQMRELAEILKRYTLEAQ